MKNSTKKSAKLILSAVCLSALIGFSSSWNKKDTSSNHKLTTYEVSTLDGKEFFKSIFFSDGALANRIDFVNNNFNTLENLKTKAEKDAYRSYEVEVMNYLQNQDPAFFEKFKKSMISKNPETIMNTLTDTGKLLVPFVDSKIKSTGLTVEKIKNNPQLLKDYKNNFATSELNRSQSCLAVLIAVEACVPGFVFAVLVAAVAPEDGVSTLNSGSNLKVEELSLSIANNL